MTDQNSDDEPIVRIVHAPTAEELALTPEQLHDLKRLRDWEQSSASAHWLIGVPACQQPGRRI